MAKAASPDVRDYKSSQDIEAELARLEKADYELLLAEEAYIESHRWEYMVPFAWQNRLGDSIPLCLIAMAPAPNKIGKTAFVVCLIMSWLRGYEAWNPVTADYPGAVKVKGRYFKPSSLGKVPPVRIRLSCEDWNVHYGETVQPEIEKWFPLEDFKRKNNSNGVTSLWTDTKTGSTLEILTHGMDIKLYESWFGDAWVPDEPPGHAQFKAMSRGLFGSKGKIVIPTTPLKEAWMLDALILKSRTDTIILDDLCCLDNEMFYDEDDKVLTEMGLSGVMTSDWRNATGDKKIFFDLIMRWELYLDPEEKDDTDSYVLDEICRSRVNIPDDQGESAEAFLFEKTLPEKHNMVIDLRFLKFAKDTAIEEKATRFFGIFKKLVGLVFKEYKDKKHILHQDEKDEKIPTDWVVTFQIDFHLGTPQAILFFAVSERDIHYCIHEIWENLSAEEIADEIVRLKTVNSWNLSYGEIDPLSKGDDKYMKNRDADAKDSFTIIEERLLREGITLGVANKDKKSGISNLKSWMKGPNKIPIIYFLDTLRSAKDGAYGIIHELKRLCYDDGGGVEKVNDHFVECCYRHTLSGVKYVKKVEYYKVSAQRAMGNLGWMR